MKLFVRIKGGPGSGNFDHAGREGFIGGSSARGSGSAIPMPKEDSYTTWPNSKELFGADTVSLVAAKRLKEGVATSLAPIAGGYSEVATIISQWADTSNDTTYLSLSLQEDAVAEFGIDLSEWQKGKLTEYHKHMAAAKEIETLNAEYLRLKKAIETPEFPSLDTVAGISPRDLQAYHIGASTYDEIMAKYPGADNPAYRAYQKDFQSYHQIEETMLQLAWSVRGSVYVKAHEYGTIGYRVTYQRESARHQPAEIQRQLLRTMYENTQKYFKDKGITEVVMYRGVSLPIGKRPNLGEAARVRGNALESWSGDPKVARNFGHAVFAMKIPVERILSTPMTGFGCLNEYEYVILGGVEDECMVVKL